MSQPQMLPLRVTRNDRIADGIHMLEFRDAGGKPLPEFSAGAHIAIQTPNGLLRKYSLCNDPAERDRYVVAIKREANGRGGSCNLIDNAKAGDELLVAPPVNDFALPQRAQDFLFIAGGIGITPIMAMIREMPAAGETLPAVLLLALAGNDGVHRRTERARIQGHVVIHYDHGDPARSLDLKPMLAERKNREHLYCCGPRPLMEAVRRFTDHWSSAAVHFEAFSDAETHKRPTSRSRCAWRIPATWSRCRPTRPSWKPCARTASTCRARARPAPAGPAAPSSSPARPTTATSIFPSTTAPDNIMICVSRALTDEITIDR